MPGATPDLVRVFQTDYPQFKKLWRANEAETLTAGVAREYYFPFPLRTGDVKPLSGLDHLKGRYFCQIRDETIDVVGEPRPVSSLFERSNSKYHVPVIVYETRHKRPDSRGLQPLQQAGQAPQRRGDPQRPLPPPRLHAGPARDGRRLRRSRRRRSIPLRRSGMSSPQPRGTGRLRLRQGRLQAHEAALLGRGCPALQRRQGTHPIHRGQVNALLKRIDDDPSDPLRNSGTRPRRDAPVGPRA